jgi:hypothetical protein
MEVRRGEVRVQVERQESKSPSSIELYIKFFKQKTNQSSLQR